MRFEIVLAPRAARTLGALPARRRVEVTDGLETHLRHEPEKVSKSRIKRLRGLSKPQYRLRVGDIRIFYDVVGSSVQILAIVKKSEADEWLRQEGVSEQ